MKRSGQGEGEVVRCAVCSMEGGRSHLLHRDRHVDDGAAACGAELETKAIQRFAKISQSISWLKAPTSTFTFKTLLSNLREGSFEALVNFAGDGNCL